MDWGQLILISAVVLGTSLLVHLPFLIMIFRRVPRMRRFPVIRAETQEELKERTENKKPHWNLELSMNTLDYRGHTFDPVEEVFKPTMGGLFSVFLQKGMPVDFDEIELTANIRLYDGCSYLGRKGIDINAEEMRRFRDFMFDGMEAIRHMPMEEIVPGAFKAQRPVAVPTPPDETDQPGVVNLKKLD